MKVYCQFSLQALNSFNLETTASTIYFPSSINELSEIPYNQLTHYYVLGEGSNTLFCHQQTPVIIKPSFKGIEVNEDDDYFYISVACAENWHQLVKFCIEKEIYGLENLALIPGSVGAAPVQNIGAYGVEVGDFIDHVSWYDFNKQKLVEYTHSQCQFAYRDSIFKGTLKGRGIITHVHFKFPKLWQPVLSYQGLNQLKSPICAQDIMLKVIQLRESKLPDPAALANAGSFFKNPIVSKKYFQVLQLQYPSIPHYQQSNGEIKLAAGWLIEQAGLKGFRQGDVGVHDKQALVLVNYANGSGQDLINLAAHVRTQVFAKFAITLVPEVRFIGERGELDNLIAECS